MNDKYELKVLGIRHHGAGSCLRVVKALREFNPDYICVEMPFEATTLFPLLLNKEIKFPIAFYFLVDC
jgi:pheromone shutdown protein TraB